MSNTFIFFIAVTSTAAMIVPPQLDTKNGMTNPNTALSLHMISVAIG